METLVKYRKEIAIFLLTAVLYFALRLPNLTLQPIFADEAIYIRWAQVMRAEPTLRFLPLSDGKTPLFMWAMIPLFKIFDDPLYAGRFLSVLSGFGTLVGVFLLGRRIFGSSVALWSALIYTVTPYTVFFDRMALVDSMLSAFTLWSLYLTVWLVQSQRLDLAMILGYMLGGALLTKTPAMINLLVLPVSLLGFNFGKLKKFNLVKLLGLWIVAIVIALGLYNILRLGPSFTQLSVRNADYIFSPTDLIGRPLDPFLPHVGDIADWFPKLLTWPILLVMAVGIIYLITLRHRVGLTILLWAIIPLVLQMAFLKTFTTRYLLFSIPPLLVIGAYGLGKLLQSLKILSIPKVLILTVLLLISPLYFNYLLVTNPEQAPLPRGERRGYLEDWTAGYGFSQIAEFLLERKKEGMVVVGTEGYFGTLPDGLQIYLDKAAIPIIGGSASVSAQLKEAASANQTFYIANKNRLPKHLDGVKLIKEYPKAKPLDGKPQDAIVVYKVLPEF